MKFENKRIRSEEIDWVQEHFKDPRLRVLQYLQLGLDECNISKEERREILGRFEPIYDETYLTNPVTKAAYMLRDGLVWLGHDPTDKWITSIYNLASNVLSYHKAIHSW